MKPTDQKIIIKNTQNTFKQIQYPSLNGHHFFFLMSYQWSTLLAGATKLFTFAYKDMDRIQITVIRISIHSNGPSCQLSV